jgi:hypothetical protein
MIDEWIIIIERSTKASNFSNFSMLPFEWLPTLSGLMMLGRLGGGVYIRECCQASSSICHLLFQSLPAYMMSCV